MPIIQPPKVVQNAVDEFLAPLFKNKPQRKHLANYLTGLMIAENKTITGMTEELPNASDQSCLNRFMTEVDWDVGAVNEARIEMMQQSEDTRFHKRGVIGLDDVLVDKTGKFIKPYILYGSTFWDHCEKRYKHARDLIVINYLNPVGGKRYPLEFPPRKQVRKKADQCEWTGDDLPSRHLPSASRCISKIRRSALFRLLNTSDHRERVIVTERKLHTPAWQRPEIRNHIHDLKNEDGTNRGYVGDLKFNRKIIFKGVEQQVQEFAATIPPEDRKPLTIDGMKQWYLSVCVKMPNVNHKVRIVILCSICRVDRPDRRFRYKEL